MTSDTRAALNRGLSTLGQGSVSPVNLPRIRVVGARFQPSLSPAPPRGYTRDPRAVPPGRLGGEEGSPVGQTSEPARVLVVRPTCQQPMRRNKILSMSSCPMQGLAQPFTFIPLAGRRQPEA